MNLNYTEALARQAEWAARNIAYNLDFIPADKLDWKPAPTAKSALEIVNHVVGAIGRLKALLSGGAFERPDPARSDFAPATNAEDAKQLLISAAQEYGQALRALASEELAR